MSQQVVKQPETWRGAPGLQKGLEAPTPAQRSVGSLQSRSWETRPWGPLVLTLWVQIAKENLSLLSHRETGGHQRRKGSPRQLCSSVRPLIPTCPLGRGLMAKEVARQRVECVSGPVPLRLPARSELHLGLTAAWKPPSLLPSDRQNQALGGPALAVPIAAREHRPARGQSVDGQPGTGPLSRVAWFSPAL